MNMKKNMVVWFEIPVLDMNRAKRFYETVFNIEVTVQDFGGVMMGFFPSEKDQPGAMGSLIQHESYIPSHSGSLLYFSSENVQMELDRVEGAKGKILQRKTQISPEHGHMATFEDTEGNRIALYSET